MSDEESDADEVLDELREMLDAERELDSIKPREAFDLWMQQQDKAEATLQSYRYRIKPFLQFLVEQGIHDLSAVTTRHIKEYEAERYESNLEKQTINNQFGTLQLFLEYCRQLNAVSEDVVKAVEIPNLTKEDKVNTEKLITQRAQEIVAELDQFRYATREHVIFLLLWRTTVRIGTIHALDLEDVYLDEADRDRLETELRNEGFAPGVVEDILDDAELPFIRPQHRDGTPLKNDTGGERVINIAEWVADVIRDYIRVNRPDIVDDHERHPLITSKKGSGRLSRSAMRNWVYILTQPCEFGHECPHDRDPDECEAREHGQGSKCPSSRSPHKIRTGSITHHRDQGWPTTALSEKANTSEELIDGVYDQPEQLIRGGSRREYLSNLDDNTGENSQ